MACDINVCDIYVCDIYNSFTSELPYQLGVSLLHWYQYLMTSSHLDTRAVICWPHVVVFTLWRHRELSVLVWRHNTHSRYRLSPLACPRSCRCVDADWWSVFLAHFSCLWLTGSGLFCVSHRTDRAPSTPRRRLCVPPFRYQTPVITYHITRGQSTNIPLTTLANIPIPLISNC